MASGAEADPLELGVFRPQLVPVRQLAAGEVGYVATGLKNVREAQVGDTVTSVARPAPRPLPGYQAAKSLVFAGIYPVSGEDYPLLRDASRSCTSTTLVHLRAESSVALGFGFRCGFLGCSTWRSSRSGSSVSSRSTSSPRRRRSSTTST
jgi:GTP-binding protein LepA